MLAYVMLIVAGEATSKPVETVARNGEIILNFQLYENGPKCKMKVLKGKTVSLDCGTIEIDKSKNASK